MFANSGFDAITIQKISNAYLVTLPMPRRGLMNTEQMQYVEAMTVAAKKIRGEDDIMDKINADLEEQERTDAANNISDLEAVPNVFSFPSMSDALAFLYERFKA